MNLDKLAPILELNSDKVTSLAYRSPVKYVNLL
jgi:hypothetical protein